MGHEWVHETGAWEAEYFPLSESDSDFILILLNSLGFEYVYQKNNKN